MKFKYSLISGISDELLALIYDREILPTPAGVKAKFYLFPAYNIFGFTDTGFQPWGQAPFWDGRVIG